MATLNRSGLCMQAMKRQQRAQQASFGRGLAPDPGAVRNLHKRKGGARRSDYYGELSPPSCSFLSLSWGR